MPKLLSLCAFAVSVSATVALGCSETPPPAPVPVNRITALLDGASPFTCMDVLDHAAPPTDALELDALAALCGRGLGGHDIEADAAIMLCGKSACSLLMAAAPDRAIAVYRSYLEPERDDFVAIALLERMPIDRREAIIATARDGELPSELIGDVVDVSLGRAGAKQDWETRFQQLPALDLWNRLGWKVLAQLAKGDPSHVRALLEARIESTYRFGYELPEERGRLMPMLTALCERGVYSEKEMPYFLSSELNDLCPRPPSADMPPVCACSFRR